MVEQQLPVNIYRARQALARLRERVTPRRSEGWLFASQDPALRARVRQAVDEQVARVLAAEGPGQFDQNLTYRTPDPVWFPSHDRTTIPFRPGAELVEIRDHIAGHLGRLEGIDSITEPAADGATLRVRLGTGTTIDIDLTEVPKC